MSVTLSYRKIFKIVRLPQNFKNLNDFLKNLLSALTLYILDKNLQLQYYGFLCRKMQGRFCYTKYSYTNCFNRLKNRRKLLMIKLHFEKKI